MNRRIVIVGFMGCGKTTVARALAQRLRCKMIDLDSFISEREGRSPAEIIKDENEQTFRALETKALCEVLENTGAGVIAAGGGTWTLEQNRELIRQHDYLTIWLDVPFETCWQRITSIGNATRPLAPNRQVAIELYQSRQAVYQLADMRLTVNDPQPAEAVVDEILTQTSRG